MDRKLCDLLYSGELTFGWPGHLQGYSLPFIGLLFFFPSFDSAFPVLKCHANTVGLQSRKKMPLFLTANNMAWV